MHITMFTNLSDEDFSFNLSDLRGESTAPWADLIFINNNSIECLLCRGLRAKSSILLNPVAQGLSASFCW